MSKTPTIGGIKMKKLGKGKPGRMKSLVKRHLGDKAADKITKSDGAALMAKGKKTGNTELTRKGSFIKNMMNTKETYLPDDGTDQAVSKAKSMTPGESASKAANRARKMREDSKPFAESREYQRTKELARAGLIGKKDLSTFEYIMRKMDNGQALTQKERNFVAGIYDNLLKSIIKNPDLFTRFRAMARRGKFSEEFTQDVNELHEATQKLHELEEKVLTKAEKKKREEVAQAIERDNPSMPMAKKMAIATATAKRVAEDSHADGSYSKKKLKMAADAAVELDSMLGDSDDLPEWVQGKITKAADYLDSARDYMKNKGDDGKAPVSESPEAWKKWAKTAAGKRYASLSTKEKEAKAKRNRMNESCCDDCNSLDEELIQEEVLIMEAGEKKKVKLNKIQRGGSKKFYVYTRNDKGNVVKVSFGDPGLSIKRDDPERRKSFRARHNCDNPGPKWKARYWSCRQWRAGAKVEG